MTPSPASSAGPTAGANAPLCAVGSGDTDAPGVTTRGKVRGVMAVSEKNGYCSQVMLLDPDTGERHYYRTSPNQAGGSLAFGGPYAAWLGPTLIELWRDDLVRTIQYGDLPAPPKPNAAHTRLHLHRHRAGRRAVRHRRALRRIRAPNARVVINWATPDSAPDKPDDQDVFKHDPRADIDTGVPAARIVGITADRVAVLVSASGTGRRRLRRHRRRDLPDPGRHPRRDRSWRPTSSPPSGGTVPTPAVRDGTDRYSLIGDRLLGGEQPDRARCRRRRRTSRPARRRSPTPSRRPSGVLAGDHHGVDDHRRRRRRFRSRTSRCAGRRTARWACRPSIGDQLLMPVTGGLAVFAADQRQPGHRAGRPSRSTAAGYRVGWTPPPSAR